MKIIIYILFIAIASSCNNEVKERNQIGAAKSDMINYFQKTLVDNFIKADNEAVRLLLEGMIEYNYNYIIEVDRMELAIINNRIKDVLKSYFYDYEKMASKRIMPEDWTQPKLFNPYTPMSATEFSKGPNTYWHNEVSSSQNPFIQSVFADCEAIGGYTFTVMNSWLKYNLDKNLISVSNEEVMTFITLSFWEYLCYCGNIDFVTGFDKTESIVRRSEVNQ